MSNFPVVLENFTPKVDNVDDVMAVDVNELQAVVEAIQAKIGIDNSAVPASIDYLLRAMPEGTMINGRILPSLPGGNISVALVTLAGTAPSASDPVYVKIDGVSRVITGALAKLHGAGVDSFDMSNAELAAKEVNLFTYLYWNATNSVVGIAFSRIPFATVGADFSDGYGSAKGNAAYDSAGGDGAFDAGHNPTFVCVNIGRFAATLSAGLAWSLPTFTASNLIQRPIYESDLKDILPFFDINTLDDGAGGQPTVNYCNYRIKGRTVEVYMRFSGTKAATGDYVRFQGLPFIPLEQAGFDHWILGNGSFYNGTNILSAPLVEIADYYAMYFPANVADNTALAYNSLMIKYEI